MKLLILFALGNFFVSVHAQDYIFGDSQAFLIAKHSRRAKLLPSLSKYGVGVAGLKQMVQDFQDQNVKIRTLFLSIGVNDCYDSLELQSLLNQIKTKFLNAQVIAIKGSFGWGNCKNITSASSRYNRFFEVYWRNNIYVIGTPIGKGDPHHDKLEYMKIGHYIDYILARNQQARKH